MSDFRGPLGVQNLSKSQKMEKSPILYPKNAKSPQNKKKKTSKNNGFTNCVSCVYENFCVYVFYRKSCNGIYFMI